MRGGTRWCRLSTFGASPRTSRPTPRGLRSTSARSTHAGRAASAALAAIPTPWCPPLPASALPGTARRMAERSHVSAQSEGDTAWGDAGSGVRGVRGRVCAGRHGVHALRRRRLQGLPGPLSPRLPAAPSAHIPCLFARPARRQAGRSLRAGAQALALSLAGVLFLVGWFLAVWRPFFQRQPPEPDWRDPEELSPAAKLKRQAISFVSDVGKSVGPYIKVRPESAPTPGALACARLLWGGAGANLSRVLCPRTLRWTASDPYMSGFGRTCLCVWRHVCIVSLLPSWSCCWITRRRRRRRGAGSDALFAPSLPPFSPRPLSFLSLLDPWCSCATSPRTLVPTSPSSLSSWHASSDLYQVRLRMKAKPLIQSATCIGDVK